MSSAKSTPLLTRLAPRGLSLLVTVIAIAFIAAVLVPGFRLASVLANSTAALRFITEQRRYPDTIRSALDAVRERVDARGYIQAPLDQIRQSVKELDRAISAMSSARSAGWFDQSNETAALAGGEAAQRIVRLRDLWAQTRDALAPLLRFTGLPYRDSETTGTELNEGGRRLLKEINTAIHVAHRTLPQMDVEIASIGSSLQADNSRSATQLRLVMTAGLLLAGTLVGLLTLLLASRRKQESTLRQVRQQTEDILRTVRDGLFLLDQKLIIGSAYSQALEGLFQRKDFAGLAFEDLLKGIVAERTLATAVKFVAVLWTERTNEKLVKSINPLGEVEVHFDLGHGKLETRYLEFDFHRVRIDGKIAQVLVSVSDITAKIELSAELRNSQSQAQSQVDTLLGILHVDPAQLSAFLGDANAAMKMINAVLREPARDESMFRKKLDTLFRQAHSVKGEAAALGLSSIESRAHSFEDDLKALLEKPGLSGNDFLPLVIKLDDLFTHLQSISDLVSRLSRLHVSSDAVHTSTLVIAPEAVPADKIDGPLPAMLQQLAQRVARDNEKEVTVRCVGFENLPESYRRIVKDITIQAVRNAVVHGIEKVPVRRAAGKGRSGTVRLELTSNGESGYKLTVEDDGQGLSTERIKEVALKKGLITADQSAVLDAKQTFALLFQSGFSTVETTNPDAGRGIGMNLIAELVHQSGGRITVATSFGKFTRLTMTFGAPAQRAGETEAA